MKEVILRSSAGFFCRAELADSLWSRGWGLLGRKGLGEERGLWIRPCKSVHTLLMGFPIDVVYLDADGTVTKTRSNVRPFRFSFGGKKAHSTLELPAGFLERKPLQVGDRLIPEPVLQRFREAPVEDLSQDPEPVQEKGFLGFSGRSSKSIQGESQPEQDTDAKKGRQSNKLNISILQVDDSKFPEVSTLFSVNQKGRPISSIEPSQLKIEESGAPASLLSMQREIDDQLPLSVLIAVNIGWLTDAESMTKAKAFATNLVGQLKPEDKAAILSFNEKGTVRHAFTDDKGSLNRAISHLSPGRKTGLPDIVSEVAQMAIDSGEKRLAVVLLIDSCEFLSRSKVSVKQSLKQAHETGCPFIVAGIGAESDVAQDGHIYVTGLTSPAGGQLLEEVEPEHATQVFASVEELLRTNYVVGFQSSTPAFLHDRMVKLSLGKGKAKGSASVNYLTRRKEQWQEAFVAAAAVRRKQEALQVLFPSPHFVMPMVFPAVMVGVGVGVSFRAILQLMKVTGSASINFTRNAFAKKTRKVVPVVSNQPRRGDPVYLRNHLRGNAAEFDADDSNFGSHATVLVFSELDENRLYPVVGKPVTVGTGDHCDIQLPAAPGVYKEHARLWWRDGRLMLHHLAPGQTTIVSGRHILWTSLEDGDEAAIGPYLLRIALQREEFYGIKGLQSMRKAEVSEDLEDIPLLRSYQNRAAESIR